MHRSHLDFPQHPFTGAAAWRGEQLRTCDDWRPSFTAYDIDDLRRATRHACGTGKPVTALTLQDFPLRVLTVRLDRWRDEIHHGRGFVLLRGMPVSEFNAVEREVLYWGLGLHFGTAVPQNTDGDLLGHVRDTGENPATRGVRLYRTTAEQDFHTDGADVIGLFCLTTAKSGGISRIVSSVSVFNQLLAQAPELVPTLFDPFPFDRQGQEPPGEPGWFEAPICRMVDGRLATFFIPWYIRESQELADAPRLSAAQLACVELIESLANDPNLYLDMDFQPGDIQLLANSVILHKRTAYEDWDEPSEKRHLLRLWLAAGGAAAIE